MNDSQRERDAEEMAEEGDPTQTQSPACMTFLSFGEGRTIHSVRAERRDLIVPARIGTNSNHLFLIY